MNAERLVSQDLSDQKVVAKLFEAGDHVIFEATGQLLSGHTLKHVIAAFSAWPVIAALAERTGGQNGRATAASVVA